MRTRMVVLVGGLYGVSGGALMLGYVLAPDAVTRPVGLMAWSWLVLSTLTSDRCLTASSRFCTRLESWRRGDKE